MGRKLKLGFVLLAASSLAVAQSTTPPAKPAGAAQVAQAPAAGGAATGAGGGSVAVAGTATGVSVGTAIAISAAAVAVAASASGGTTCHRLHRSFTGPRKRSFAAPQAWRSWVESCTAV